MLANQNVTPSVKCPKTDSFGAFLLLKTKFISNNSVILS